MSGRGRGKVVIKRGTPNLAQAGVRENVSNGKIKKERNTNNGRGAHRGGRGRGRGQKRPEYIQTGGVFSEGLHSEAVKKNRDSEYISFARDSRNGRVKTDGIKMEIEDGEGKASFEGWDAEWRSDSDEDKEDLKEVLGGDDFISDYKRGDRLPLVLPVKDESQYRKLMSNRFQVDDPIEDDQEIKCLREKATNPTGFLSKEAGEILNKAIEDESDSLILFQLPSVVNVLTGSSSLQNSTEESAAPNSLPNLPSGKTIGKLQITRGGRTMLRIGDFVMDVTKAAPTELSEHAVLLESRPESFAAQGAFRAPDTGNSIYHLGEIKHGLVASLDWKNLKTSAVKPEPPQISSPQKPDLSVMQELLALDKEMEKWKIDAERWAKP